MKQINKYKIVLHLSSTNYELWLGDSYVCASINFNYDIKIYQMPIIFNQTCEAITESVNNDEFKV